MRISPNDVIAGQQALQIRALLRRSDRSAGWDAELVVEILSIPESEAQRVVEELAASGFIEPAPSFEAERLWQNTTKGNALAQASAAKPITRATAERLVAGVLDRARQVNDGSVFAFKVERVLAFGSFTTGKTELSDVDLAVELVPQFAEKTQQEQREKERVRVAREGGRHFAFVDQLVWPETEVARFLKNRSRYVSLHRPDELLRLKVDARLLFHRDPSQR